MILQVNKKKKEDKDMIRSIDLIFESKVGNFIKQEQQSIFSSKSFGRKSGKTTLIARLAIKYDLPIVVSHSFEKKYIENNNIEKYNIYSMDSDFDKFHGSNITLVLVDNITDRDVLALNNAGISVIGFVNYKKNDENKIYEDYIEISSVIKLSDGICANFKQHDTFLSYDKKFYTDDSYGIDNQHFYIDSVYLLDNTGKTIKKLI